MSDIESMMQNQKRALSKGLAALEAMADLWAVEVRLSEMAKRIADVPDAGERAKRIAAMIHLGFVEGAYQHFLDHKDARDRASMSEQLATIRQAIADYHYALDTRQHGGVAMGSAFNVICRALDTYWQQGAEKARRESTASPTSNSADAGEGS